MSWLTAKRIRAQALCLALCLWGIYAWILTSPGLRDLNGLIKGTDFLHFYTLGSLARTHDGADLYDMAAQTRLIGERVPAASGTVYLPLYGPQVSLLFAPLAGLPYGVALALWWLLTAGIYVACVSAIWRTCPHLKDQAEAVWIAAIAYPAFFHLIAWGQTSALALACFTAAYLLLLRGRCFAAGLAIGCLIFKPQLGLAAAFVFCAAGEWSIVGGAILSAAAQLLIAWAYYGTASMLDYARHTAQVAHVWSLLEPRPYQTHSLRTFWQMLVPSVPAAWCLYGFFAAIVLLLTLACWRSSLPLSLRFSALQLASVLISPHLTVYDLVILAPALLLVTDWAMAHSAVAPRFPLGLTVYLIYFLPLLGPLARWTHVQLSVPVMAGLLWMIWEIAKGTAPAAAHTR